MSRSEMVGIYLAAGSSSRMGEDKLMLPFGELPLGGAALIKALQSQLDRIIIIINNSEVPIWLAESLPRCSNSWKCKIVVCRDSAEGMSRSIRAGIREALAIKARAAMILLADQPLITTEMLNQTIETFKSKREIDPKIRYVASTFGGISRPPIIFSREAFPELLNLKGDCGAKQILKQMSGIGIDYHNQDLFFDIDDKAQYAEIFPRVILNS